MSNCKYRWNKTYWQSQCNHIVKHTLVCFHRSIRGHTVDCALTQKQSPSHVPSPRIPARKRSATMCAYPQPRIRRAKNSGAEAQRASGDSSTMDLNASNCDMSFNTDMSSFEEPDHSLLWVSGAHLVGRLRQKGYCTMGINRMMSL